MWAWWFQSPAESQLSWQIGHNYKDHRRCSQIPITKMKYEKRKSGN